MAAGRIWFAPLLVVLLIRFASAQQTETLAYVLKQNAIPAPRSSLANLESAITSYATLNDDHEFLIAYYLATPENLLQFPLFLTRFNKQSGKWRSAALENLKVNGFLAPRDGTKADCIGSAMNFQSNGNYYFLNLHLNPSAGCVVVLTNELRVRDTLPGGVGAIFNNGTAVIDGNMIHFADVHPATLFLYDSATKRSQQIYPPRHDPFRDDFSTRLEKVIDEKHCRENNWGCQPDRFTTSIQDLQVSDETNSLAFAVNFETEGFLTREEAENSGKWDDDSYVYIYRLNPLRWREFSTYDIKPKFDTHSLKELLTSEKLRQVFATPAP